jgi:hypothetical protein
MITRFSADVQRFPSQLRLEAVRAEPDPPQTGARTSQSPMRRTVLFSSRLFARMRSPVSATCGTSTSGSATSWTTSRPSTRQDHQRRSRGTMLATTRCAARSAGRASGPTSSLPITATTTTRTGASSTDAALAPRSPAVRPSTAPARRSGASTDRARLHLARQQPAAPTVREQLVSGEVLRRDASRFAEERFDHGKDRLPGCTRERVPSVQNSLQLDQPIALPVDRERVSRSGHHSRSQRIVERLSFSAARAMPLPSKGGKACRGVEHRQPRIWLMTQEAA